MNENKKLKNGKIELLRFIMAVIVMFHHSHYLNNNSSILFPRGSLAVEFFFLISGYFLAVKCDPATNSHTQKTLGSDTISFLINKYKPVAVYIWISEIFGFIMSLVKPLKGFF